jgi:hypothetical protein
VEKMFIHEGYTDDGFSHDIALLRLVQPISWDEYTSPICLPATSNSSTYHYEYAVAAGWGLLGEFSE